MNQINWIRIIYYKNILSTNKYEIKSESKEIISNSLSKSTTTISYLLLFALGFHGLFEGISLGIQLTLRGTLFLILAIVLHKWAAALTLGQGKNLLLIF